MNNIAVLIPHYNNPDGLIKSIKSIDSSENVDVYIIDDGSLNKKIIEIDVETVFSANGKIYFSYLKENQGIEHALNLGIDVILQKKQYTFIARLDCGDICLGKRFFIQETFLKENPDVKLVGSKARAVDEKNIFIYNYIHPEKSSDIKKKMHVNSMFVHPCVMFKVDVIDTVGKYPTNYKSAEDYAYFFEFVKRYEVANINEALVQIEINPNGISISRRNQQVRNRLRIMLKHFYFGFWPIYGFLRSIILYSIPYSIILKIKKIVK
jgi:glycosyltransferase involved in cell wall biosynthesis